MTAENDDTRYLRAELMMRMVVQNVVVTANALLFLPVAALIIGGVGAAAAMACAYTVTVAILAAIWCHHGARQAQIKRYLLLVERKRGVAESWEQWLPRHPVGGRLGARWVISTKIPFIATTTSTALLGLSFDTTPWAIGLTIANTIGVAITALLLWTNPKEGLDSGDGRD